MRVPCPPSPLIELEILYSDHLSGLPPSNIGNSSFRRNNSLSTRAKFTIEVASRSPIFSFSLLLPKASIYGCGSFVTSFPRADTEGVDLKVPASRCQIKESKLPSTFGSRSIVLFSWSTSKRFSRSSLEQIWFSSDLKEVMRPSISSILLSIFFPATTALGLHSLIPMIRIPLIEDWSCNREIFLKL